MTFRNHTIDCCWYIRIWRAKQVSIWTQQINYFPVASAWCDWLSDIYWWTFLTLLQAASIPDIAPICPCLTYTILFRAYEGKTLSEPWTPDRLELPASVCMGVRDIAPRINKSQWLIIICCRGSMSPFLYQKLYILLPGFIFISYPGKHPHVQSIWCFLSCQ